MAECDENICELTDMVGLWGGKYKKDVRYSKDIGLWINTNVVPVNAGRPYNAPRGAKVKSIQTQLAGVTWLRNEYTFSF